MSDRTLGVPLEAHLEGLAHVQAALAKMVGDDLMGAHGRLLSSIEEWPDPQERKVLSLAMEAACFLAASHLDGFDLALRERMTDDDQAG